MPDRPAVDVAAVCDRLGWPDLTLSVVTSTGSTNDDLAEATADGSPAWTVLVADLQTVGRGRNGRTWTSPPRAGLTFSVLLRTGQMPRARWSWLPLVAGLAVCAAVGEDAAADAIGLKWPNDVLAGDRKLGGILARTTGDAVVVGMGINVDTTVEELPDPAATSLAIEFPGAGIDRSGLLVRVLQHLRARLHVDPAQLREEYLTHSVTIGREVRVSPVAGSAYAARAVDLDERGALVLERDGRREALLAGDVQTLRPLTR